MTGCCGIKLWACNASLVSSLVTVVSEYSSESLVNIQLPEYVTRPDKISLIARQNLTIFFTYFQFNNFFCDGTVDQLCRNSLPFRGSLQNYSSLWGTGDKQN